MSSQKQYVTITHYKEREFYFLNYAIQTNDGIIPKEIEQFHQSDKTKFIGRIRTIQAEHPNNQIVSISLLAKQSIAQKEDRNRASAEIFKNNYVIQENIDVGDVPTTLYFSPFAILYQQYKSILDSELKLIIGLFDRKLFMMFATSDKIHQSWTIGTRGLTEKQVAERVYKSMQAYFKISYIFADNLEMLVSSDESPKLLKVLREELSMHITLTQSSIHTLLHNMASSQEIAKSSYIKSSKKIEKINSTEVLSSKKEVKTTTPESSKEPRAKVSTDNLQNIKLKEKDGNSVVNFFKAIFGFGVKENSYNKISFISVLPLLLSLAMGGFFHMKNSIISKRLMLKEKQITAHQTNIALASASDKIFKAMGKNAELKKATISTEGAYINGVVWGIEPLKNSLIELYSDGKFVIKPLENFMTEFSFTSK